MIFYNQIGVGNPQLLALSGFFISIIMDIFYFKHELGTRSDKKIMKLISRKGMEGYGVYWSLIESLYKENGRIELDEIDIYADVFKVSVEFVKSVVKDYGLFNVDHKYFWSDGVNKRINEMESKSNTARKAAKSRWNKERKAKEKQLQSKSNANAMQTHSECNASIVEYSIEENSIEYIAPISTEFRQKFIEAYDTDIIPKRGKIEQALTDALKNSDIDQEELIKRAKKYNQYCTENDRTKKDICNWLDEELYLTEYKIKNITPTYKKIKDIEKKDLNYIPVIPKK